MLLSRKSTKHQRPVRSFKADRPILRRHSNKIPVGNTRSIRTVLHLCRNIKKLPVPSSTISLSSSRSTLTIRLKSSENVCAASEEKVGNIWLYVARSAHHDEHLVLSGATPKCSEYTQTIYIQTRMHSMLLAPSMGSVTVFYLVANAPSIDRRVIWSLTCLRQHA